MSEVNNVLAGNKSTYKGTKNDSKKVKTSSQYKIFKNKTIFLQYYDGIQTTDYNKPFPISVSQDGKDLGIGIYIGIYKIQKGSIAGKKLSELETATNDNEGIPLVYVPGKG